MPQHGMHEIKRSETFDGSDLSPAGFGLMKHVIKTYNDQRFEMWALTGTIPDKRALALQIMRLTKRGYLIYSEEPQPGKLVKMLQASPEAIQGLRNVETPAVAETPKPKLSLTEGLTPNVTDELNGYLNESMKSFDAQVAKKPTVSTDESVRRKVQEVLSATGRKPHEEKQYKEVKEVVDKELAPLYAKLELLSKGIVLLNQNVTQMSQNLNVKKHSPQEVRAEYVGSVREILSNLKNISLEGSDESILEILKNYKEARIDGNSMKEKEYAWNAVPRLESMISWYLHLTAKMGGYITYLERKLGENPEESVTDEELMSQEPEGGENGGK
jgi:hypothetical protein